MVINPFEFNENLMNLFYIDNKLKALIIFNIIGISFLSYGLYRQCYICKSNFNLFIIFIGIFNILLGCSLFLMRIFNFFIYTIFLVTIVYVTILVLLIKPYIIKEHFETLPIQNESNRQKRLNRNLSYEEKKRRWLKKQLNKNKINKLDKRKNLINELKRKSKELNDKYIEYGGCHSYNVNSFNNYCNEKCNLPKNERGNIKCEDSNNTLIEYINNTSGYKKFNKISLDDEVDYYYLSNMDNIEDDRCNEFRINNQKIVKVKNDKYHVNKCKKIPTKSHIDDKDNIKTDCFQCLDEVDNDCLNKAEDRCKKFGRKLKNTESCYPVYKDEKPTYGNLTRGVCENETLITIPY